MSRNIEDSSLSSNDNINDYDSSLDEVDKKMDLLHDSVYSIVLEMRDYIEDNQLPFLENIDYVDLINYIEDITY